MPTDVKAPHERIEAAVQRVREVAGNAEDGPWFYDQFDTVHNRMFDIAPNLEHDTAIFIALFDPTLAELLALHLEGAAAHWATRPIADWEIFNSTPLAALVRHIVGEEEKA